MVNERELNPYAVWLFGIPGIGNNTINVLMEKAACAEDIYNMREEEIREILETCAVERAGEDEKAVKAARTRAVKSASAIARAKSVDPEERAAELVRRGICFVSREEEYYPDRLREIPDSPYGLYYIRALPPADRPCVAIVGARNCSGYGREQARIYSEKLAVRGISVVSGMARGVDGIAGRAALNAGGGSYAVLGCGVDVVYPSENAELYRMLSEKGGLISEMPPGTQPRSNLFPKRNRLISGLADAVLVIEARRRSGTVITVDAALEQGRDIFALPGRVSDSLSDGCNYLISQGAAIACTPDTVVEHFYGVTDSGTDFYEMNRKKRLKRRDELNGLEAVFFDVLGQGDVMETDFLLQRAEFTTGKRISVEEFMSCMVSLQIRGLAEEVGIGHYRGI